MIGRWIIVVLVTLAACGLADAAPPPPSAKPKAAQDSINDTSLQLPTFKEFVRVIKMEDYNTRVVILGTTLLGLAAGTIGAFMLLRKRALMGDALSHATLPGIGLAFIFSVAGGGTARRCRCSSWARPSPACWVCWRCSASGISRG
ncbi:MAG: metal ABC transporter permease [Tepidisphaeraceae bacterium]